MQNQERLAKFMPVDGRWLDVQCGVCGTTLGTATIGYKGKTKFIPIVVLLPIYSQREEGFFASRNRPPRRKRLLHRIIRETYQARRHLGTTVFHVGELVDENGRVKCATCDSINRVVKPN